MPSKRGNRRVGPSTSPASVLNVPSGTIRPTSIKSPTRIEQGKYSFYSQIAMLCSGAENSVSKTWLQRLSHEGASCFWTSLVSTMPSGAFTAKFEERVARLQREGRLQSGVTIAQAKQHLKESGVRECGIYYHDPRGGEVTAITRGTTAKGILFVEVDCDGRGPAHWIPIERIRECARMVTIYDADEELLFHELPFYNGGENYVVCVKEERPKTTEELFRELPFQDGEEDEERNVAALRSPWFGCPLGPVQAKEESLRSSLEFEENKEWEAVESERVVIDRLRRNQEAKEYHALLQEMARDRKRREVLKDIEEVWGRNAPPMLPRTVNWYGYVGGPTYGHDVSTTERQWGLLKRLVNTASSEITEMYELSSELVGLRVQHGALVYSRIAADSPCDERMYSNGTWKHSSVHTLATSEGVLELHDTVVIDGCEVSQLRRGKKIGITNFDWAKLRRVNGEEVKELMLMQRNTALLQSEFPSLPNPTARLRAINALMKPLLPEELVGPMNDVRLEMMASDEKEKMCPASAAKEMCAAWEGVTRITRPGFAHK